MKAPIVPVERVKGWCVVLRGKRKAFVAYHDQGQTKVNGSRVFQTRKAAREFAKELRDHVSGQAVVCRAEVRLEVWPA